MLSKVLEKSTCAKCRICCEFDREDEWETPVINKYLKEKLEAEGKKTVEIDGCYKYDLEFKGEEIKTCPFHSAKTGCVLDEENKPFDCKIWPLRVMNKNGKKVLAIAKLCPNFNESKEELLNLIENELLDEIKAYISNNPYLINDFKSDYEVLKEL